MAQQLPLYQIPMAQQQPIIGVDMTQQDYNNLQQQGLANIQPDQQLIAQSAQQQGYNLPPLQVPQQPQPKIVDVSESQRPVLGVADAHKSGTDWIGLLQNLGGYLSAAGSAYGTGKTPQEGFLNATNATQKRTQDINQYDVMSPQYQSMGYDVSGLDPRRGGAGIPTTPDKMIELQSKIAQQKYLNDYRNAMLRAKTSNSTDVATGGTKGVTIGTLRMMSPQFKKMIDDQYGFSNGQNLKLLDQIVPASMVQGYMPAVTKTSNMVYSGGLHSSQNKTGRSDIYHHSNGGSSGGKGKPNAHTW